jgi:tRNA(Ile)-lysidine synthase
MVALDVFASLHLQRMAHVQVAHVNHGLNPEADVWAMHVQKVSARLGLVCHVLRVNVCDLGRGIEDAARKARYQAVETLGRDLAADAIVLAHHANDQAETMLLQLLRGSGVAGLSGMPRWAPNTQPVRWRPLLDLASDLIGQYAREQQLVYVEDPSNDSRKFARNAIRHAVMPQLEAIRTGAVSAICRSMQHLQEVLALESEVARLALPEVLHCGGLKLEFLKTMSQARRNAVVRAWVQLRGVEAPSTTALEELARQMFEAHAQTHPELRHGQHRFVRDSSTLYLVRQKPESPQTDALMWDSHASWRPQGWFGEFHFRRSGHGVPESMLNGMKIEAKSRIGGETLKLAINRPRRTLKQWYQTLGVPLWRRDASPLLWLGGELLFVPYVGMNSTLFRQAEVAEEPADGASFWLIDWQAD